MQAIGRGFSARLRVGYTSIALEAITAMVARVREKQGAVAFSLQQGEPRLLETLVEQRRLDFAVTHLPVADAALHVLPLAALQLMLVVKAEETGWRAGDRIPLQSLADAPLILLRRSSGIGIFEYITGALRRANVGCTIAADCTDVSAIYAQVRQGVGFGVIPVHAEYEPPPGLRFHSLSLVVAPEPLALIYPRGGRLLPAVQAAIDLCRDLAR
jgi:DNA-binding transcriptional LysR family regulator